MITKPTFLNQTRPLITSMIIKDNPDSIRFAIKNAIYDGADCLGIQLEKLKKENKTEEIYKKIFSACSGHPIFPVCPSEDYYTDTLLIFLYPGRHQKADHRHYWK